MRLSRVSVTLASPKVVDPESRRPMPRMMATGTPGFAPDQLCGWRDCRAAVTDLPLCWQHMLAAHAIVEATRSAMAEGLAERPARPDTRTGSVYFLRYRDTVKIGYSIEPATRIAQHPHDEVLAIVSGTMQDERRCHAAFAHLRMPGHREWFRATTELLDWIADLSARR